MEFENDDSGKALNRSRRVPNSDCKIDIGGIDNSSCRQYDRESVGTVFLLPSYESASESGCSTASKTFAIRPSTCLRSTNV